MKDYYEIVDKSSLMIVLFLLIGSLNFYYSDYGWVVDLNIDIVLLGFDILWFVDGSMDLMFDMFLILIWDNGFGFIF